jgi:UDP-N-acetylglucosamine 2-epimerase
MLNILTIDIEDYFQVHAFSDVVKYEDWGIFECRIERNTDRLLEILSSSIRNSQSATRTQNSESNNSVFGTQPSCIYNVEPLGYLDFLSLMSGAKLVITDSGGIQEETTILGIPCVTLRENTERPITTTQGTNVIVGTNPRKIVEECMSAFNKNRSKKRIPTFWDGKAGDRIVSILAGGISQLK